MRRYGVSESTSQRRQLARAVASSSTRRERRRARPMGDSASASLEDLEHRHAPCRAATTRRRVITTFASLACSRCATAGAAKPEKIGTWIAPMCAHRVRGDRDLGRHRQEDRDAVARLDAERDEHLGEPRHVVGELGEGELASRAVLAEPDGGERIGRRSAQRWTQLSGDRDLRRRRTRSSTPGRASRRRPRPRLRRTRAPCPRSRAARTTRGPPATGARARRSRRRRPGARAGSRSHARSCLVGPPDDVGHGAQSTRTGSRGRLAPANLARTNFDSRGVGCNVS